MVIKIKHYLVDSENVNDNWLMLLELADEKDEMIIFYTKNSPHMSYSSVIKLLQQRRTLQFEECYEGQNALDFQLISYLGYLIGKDEDKTSEFIVMSNDTGFDPAVRYWKQKGFLVNRINVNYCKLTLQRHKEAPSGNIEEELPFTEPAAEESALPAAPVKETSPEKSIDFNKAEVDTFINCFGKNNPVALQETFVHVYGQEQGQIIYKTVKDDSYSYTPETFTGQDRIQHFTNIIFAHSDVQDPGDFVQFLDNNKSKSKNLNGIRASIIKAYGKENGMKYYSLFKPYFKMISALK